MIPNSRRDTRALFWWSFALRFAIALLVWGTRDLTSMGLLDDAAAYNEAASSVAADWLAGRPSLWLHNAIETGTLPWLMIIMLAGIKYLFGGLDVLPVLLAVYCLLSAWTPTLVYRITEECGGDRRSALFAGRIVAFLPAFVFWGGVLYKDGLVFLALSLIVLHTLRLQRGFKAGSFLVLVCTLPALYGLRFYMAFIAAGAVSVSLLFGGTTDKRIGSTTVTLLRQCVLLALFGVVLISTGLAGKFADLMPRSVPEFLERFDLSRSDLAAAPSGYMSEVSLQDTQQTLAFLPRGVAWFLTVPMPWQLGSARQNLAIADTTLWLLLYPLVAVGMWRLIGHNRQAAALFLVLSITIVLFYGLLAGNIGTTYRMRAQVWLLWSVLAAIGWSSIQGSRASTRAGSLAP